MNFSDSLEEAIAKDPSLTAVRWRKVCQEAHDRIKHTFPLFRQIDDDNWERDHVD